MRVPPSESSTNSVLVEETTVPDTEISELVLARAVGSGAGCCAAAAPTTITAKRQVKRMLIRFMVVLLEN
jgi:hypothetical protein